MNRLLTILLLVMLVQTTSHAQTDYYATETTEHLASILNEGAYHWDIDEGIAIIPLRSGDTVKFRKGGNEMDVIDLYYTEDITRSERTFDDFQYWLSRGMKFAKWTFPRELYEEMQKRLVARNFEKAEGKDLTVITWRLDGSAYIWLWVQPVDSQRIEVWLQYHKSHGSEVSKK